MYRLSVIQDNRGHKVGEVPKFLFFSKAHIDKLLHSSVPSAVCHFHQMAKTDGDDSRTRLLARGGASYGTDEPDAALALFRDEQELHELIDPEKEQALVRKIDFMIMP